MDFTKKVVLLMAEILHQLRLVVYPIIYKVLYIPGGAGFLNHQQSTVVLEAKGRGVSEHRRGEQKNLSTSMKGSNLTKPVLSMSGMRDPIFFCQKKNKLAQTPWQSWRMKI